MVASVLFKHFVVLLISCVIGTLGLGPLYPRIPVGFNGIGRRPGGRNVNLIRNQIEECGHRYNGRPYICYDTNIQNFHCIDESQVCDGYADCFSKDDEQGCATSRRASSYSFTTTTTTVMPTSTSISTYITTSVTKETGSTTTTTTRTGAVLATSTVQVRFIYGMSSATATSTQTDVLANALVAVTILTNTAIPAGAFTCVSALIPAGGVSLVGNNDFVFVTTLVTHTLTAVATATCIPTSTIYT